MIQTGLFDALHQTEIAQARAALAPGLHAIVAGYGSQRAAWEALHRAGIFPEAIGRYYAAVRRHGVGEVIDGLFTYNKLGAIRTFVEGPREHVQRRVAVSTLANQFYCEMQVHLARSHALHTVSVELAAGAAGHAAFEAEAKPVSAEEIDRAAREGRSLELVEMPVEAGVHGVRLVGRADRVHLTGRSATLVVEFKFSGRRELYPSHVVQVGAYGRMLAEMGYATDRLIHAVAVLPRGPGVPDGLAATIAERALEALATDADEAVDTSETLGAREVQRPGAAPDPLDGLNVRRVDSEAFGLWVFRHHPMGVERDLAWALGYWTGLRQPQGTRSRGKCRACPFNAAGLCTDARAEPDGRYAVRRTERPQGVVHLVRSTARVTRA